MRYSALSKTFSSRELIRYAIPSILTMIFMSTYTIVDGIFVARFVNEMALSAVNIVYPLFSFVLALGLMFASGANAVIGKLLGEGKNRQANQFFTLLYIISVTIGIFFAFLGYLAHDHLIRAVGASDSLYPYAKSYLTLLAPFAPFLFLQVFTQYFFVTAGKPTNGLIACFVGGVANIVLDYVFIVTLDMSIAGAALATGIGFAIPGIFGVLYFLVKRKSSLRFVKPALLVKNFFMCLYNGMSELVGNLALSITTFIFNMILLRIAGEGGVAAITVILYVAMFQTAISFGFSLGVSPIISYKFGEQNYEQLKKILRVGINLLFIISIVTVIFSFIFAEYAVSIFILKESTTFEMAVIGFKIYSIAYFFMGINIFASAGFTALSNGTVSAILSIARTLVFIVIALLTLPHFFGLYGVWAAVPIAELVSFFLSLYFYKKNKSKYHY